MIATFLTALVLQASVPTVLYEVRLDNADHHEAHITATFTDVPEGTLELRMSRSSPGRYALHEFAKNVYDVRVTDGRGGRSVGRSRRPDRARVERRPGTAWTRRSFATDIFGDRCRRDLSRHRQRRTLT